MTPAYYVRDESGHAHAGPIPDEERAFEIREECETEYSGTFYVEEEDT